MSSCRSLKQVTHCLFDMDGVLLDTETLYTIATQNVLDEWGKVYNWDIKVQLMGLHGKDVSKKLVEIYDLPIPPQELHNRLYNLYRKCMPQCNLMPDTEIHYKRAIQTIASKFGKKYTTDVQYKVMGRPAKESAIIAVQEMKLPISEEEFLKNFASIAYKYMKNVYLMPGAASLVKHLKANNIPIAVATSSSSESFEFKTKNHKEFFSLFDHIVCGGSDPEVTKGKPNPDIFLVCASRFSDKPCSDKCLVFEDAPNGVKAAISAGMQCIMIPDENVPPELTKEANVVIKSLKDAPLELFGLPSVGCCT